MTVTFIRTIIVYAIIIFSIRVMGRRQVGELQPSELVVTILISNLASRPMEDRSLPLSIGILPIITLVCLEVFMSYALKNSPKFRKHICGSPQVIIRNGKIDQKVMKELRFSVDDLMEELRINSIFDFTEVDCAIVETTGELSVFKKYKYQEVQNGDLGNCEDKTSCPAFVVVNNGCLNNEGIKMCEKDKQFINKKLKKEKIELTNVLVMLCDKTGKYTIVEKE